MKPTADLQISLSEADRRRLDKMVKESTSVLGCSLDSEEGGGSEKHLPSLPPDPCMVEKLY